MAQRKRRPTMQDVANHAGVSRTTVSFVMNHVQTSSIPEETRERVWDAVRELDYRPNAVAQNLRTRRTNVIGFLTDEIASTPYAFRVVEGAQAAAWEAGKLLMIVNTGRNTQIKDAGAEMMLERQVDGLIYAAWYHRMVQPPAQMHEVPAVLVDCFDADRALPSVVPDEVQGGRTATEHLLQHGHQRIAFINLDPAINAPAANGRLAGYRAALSAARVTYDPALVVNGDGNPAQGYELTKALMRRRKPPTALFCGHDRTAFGAYQALGELGLRVPHDVAVIGFDNQELLAANLRPPLTTVALPHYEMGAWAVRYLLKQIEQADQPDTTPPVQHLAHCDLVERQSV